MVRLSGGGTVATLWLVLLFNVYKSRFITSSLWMC
jgi:hypothetical protein